MFDQKRKKAIISSLDHMKLALNDLEQELTEHSLSLDDKVSSRKINAVCWQFFSIKNDLAKLKSNVEQRL